MLGSSAGGSGLALGSVGDSGMAFWSVGDSGTALGSAGGSGTSRSTRVVSIVNSTERRRTLTVAQVRFYSYLMLVSEYLT